MGTLEGLHRQQSSSWKRALKHKSGTVVYLTKEPSSTGPGKGGRFHKAPVFKGELDIMGFPPVAVFGVVGTRKLWDDWCVFLLAVKWMEQDPDEEARSQVQGGEPRPEPVGQLVPHLHVSALAYIPVFIH